MGDVLLITSPKARILAVIFTGALLIAIDGSTISPVLSMIQDTFGVNESTVSWIFNIEVLFLMLMTPVTAKLSDLFGRRNIYTACVFSFLTGTIIITISQSFEILLIGRALQGFGATISVLAITIIGDHFSEEKGTVLGVFGCVIALVYAAGPVISGFLTQFGWRWIFAINIPIAILLILFSYHLLPKTWITGEKEFDLKGMILLGIATASFAMLVLGAGSSPLSYLWALFGICIVCLVLFFHVERYAGSPILPLHLFKKRNTLVAGVITIAGYLAGAGTYFFSSYAVLAFGLDYSLGAYALIPFTIATLITTIIVGRLLDKVGARPIMIMGGVFSATGMLLLSCSESLYIFWIAIVLIGIGNASVIGNALYYIFLKETGEKDRASGQAMLNVLLNAGSLIGCAVLGIALSAGTIVGFHLIYRYLAVIYIILAILALTMKTDRSPLILKDPEDD